MPTLLSIFHFPHVKLANSRDGVASVDDRGCLSLRFGEDDVDEILRRRDRGDLFEVVLRHFFVCCLCVYKNSSSSSDDDQLNNRDNNTCVLRGCLMCKLVPQKQPPPKSLDIFFLLGV